MATTRTKRTAPTTPTPPASSAGVDHTDPRVNPIALVQWVDPNTLHANSYNPNHVFGPERELLKQSLIEDGWCAAIVARPDGEVVDGFHRWTIHRTSPEVRAALGELCPVIFLRPSRSKADQVFTTVRMNRARGQHGILKMGDILRSLQAEGLADDAIRDRMGMDQDEFARLKETAGTPDLVGKESFGKAWIPHLPEGETRVGRHKAEKATTEKRKPGGRGVK